LTSALLIPLGGLLATRMFSQVLRLPRVVLAPLIMALTVVGVYCINNSIFDLYMMFCFGLIGYSMEKLEFPLAPAVLGLILGPMAETNLRLSLLIGQGDWSILVVHSISQIIIAMTVLVLCYPLLRLWLDRRGG